MPDCDQRFFDRTEKIGRVNLRRHSTRVSKILPGNRGMVEFFPENSAPLLQVTSVAFNGGRFTPSGAEVRASVKRENRTVAASRIAKPRQVELARGGWVLASLSNRSPRRCGRYREIPDRFEAVGTDMSANRQSFSERRIWNAASSEIVKLRRRAKGSEGSTGSRKAESRVVEK